MKPPKRYTLTSGLMLDYKPFDDDHARLFDLLNDLGVQLSNASEADRLAGLRQFADAFIAHMNREVRILELLGYPDVGEHETNHAKLEADANAFLERCRTGAEPDPGLEHFAWCLLEDAIKEDLKAKYFLAGKPDPTRGSDVR